MADCRNFQNLGSRNVQKILVVPQNLVNKIFTIGFKRFLISLPQIARERMTMNIFTKVAEFVEKECKGMLTMSSNQLHTASAPSSSLRGGLQNLEKFLRGTWKIRGHANDSDQIATNQKVCFRDYAILLRELAFRGRLIF